MTRTTDGPSAIGLRILQSASVTDTERVGRALARHLAGDEIILLHGDLGVGKTVLVRGLAAGLGFDAESVQSPTFSLIREHEPEDATGAERHPTKSVARRLVHIDLYRLSPEEAEAMGIDDCLAAPGVKAVEWPERLPEAPSDALAVSITREDDEGRTIRIEGPATVIDAVVGALG